MKNDRIKVSFGATVNLGKYESARFDVEYETDIGEDEKDEDAIKETFEVVKLRVRQQIAVFKKEGKGW